jgi:hypothetical protein
MTVMILTGTEASLWQTMLQPLQQLWSVLGSTLSLNLKVVVAVVVVDSVRTFSSCLVKVVVFLSAYVDWALVDS